MNGKAAGVAWRAVVAAALCLFATFRATAQTPAPTYAVRPEFRTAPRSLITGRVDRAQRVETAGAVNPRTAAAQDLGLVDDATPIERIQLMLLRPAERQAAFDAEVEAQNRPGSPNFHQWLTPEQIGAEFGPSAADIAAVTNYLQGEGFRVNAVGKSGMYVDFSGTAAQVRNSFGAEVHNFRLASGEVKFSAAQPAQIPEALAPAVAGFVSISNIPARSLRRRSVRSQHLSPAYLDGSGYQKIGVQDFYTIYKENPLLTQASPINGAGQTVAVLEETDITPNDVVVFGNTFGVTLVAPPLTHGSASVACTDPGVTSTDEEGEAVLDAEWASATAPGATLLFMTCATAATQGILLSAEAVIDDNLAGTMSLSYGETERGNTSLATFMTALWEQAAAQGQTVMVSAGDSGSDTESDGLSIASHGINVNVLGSTVYNVSAGGTDFQDQYNQDIDSGTSFGVGAFWSTSNGYGLLSAKGYIAETTWNDTCASSLINVVVEKSLTATPAQLCEDTANRANFLTPVAGGGGPSVRNARPGWQNATVVGIPTTSTYTGRLLPDISLFASNGIWGHAIYQYQSDDGGLYDAGGTSFVAPQLAGVFALLEQKTGGRLGVANVQLYNLAGQEYGVSTATGACNGSGASGVGETASQPASTCVFNDIQTGNNSDGCTSGTTNCYPSTSGTDGIISTSTSTANAAFSAHAGYDMATGLGSINIANLVNNWANATLEASQTTLSLTQTSFTPGTSITFSTTVSPVSGTGTPTGTVGVVSQTRYVANADVTLSSGTGSGSTKSFLPGQYTVYASYLGDGTFAPSQSPGIAVSVQYATTTTLAAPNPSTGVVYGNTVALTATLSPTTSGSYTATGTINFLDGTTVICAAVAFNANGVATCTTPALTATTHSFTASYSGSTDFAASTSGVQTLTVAKETPSLTVSNAAVSYGTGVTTLTVTETFASGLAPTGALTVQVDGGTALAASCLGSASPVSCTAAVTTATLNTGSHTIAAALAADLNFNAASGSGTLTVTAAAPTITFGVMDHYATDAPFTVAASSNSGGGFSYNITSGPASVSGGTVTLTGSTGSVTIVASQAASGNYAAGSQTATFAVSSGQMVWVGNQNSTLSAFTTSGTAHSPVGGFTGGGLGTIAPALGMAFDHSGNLWIANSGSGGGISEFNGAGTALTSSLITAGGVSNPLALAVDGVGQIWIANGNGSVSVLNNSGSAVTPSTGYTGSGLATPGGIAIDVSGNVWVTNASNNSVTEIIGGAAPVAPLATSLTNATTGARP